MNNQPHAQMTSSQQRQAMFNSISNQITEQLANSFQGQLDLFKTAVILSQLPNWKQLLDKQYEEFEEYSSGLKENALTSIKNQVDAGDLIEASSALSHGYDVGLNIAKGHFNRLSEMIESISPKVELS